MANKDNNFPQRRRRLPSRGRASRSVTPDKLWKLYDGQKVSLKVKV